MFWSFRRTVTGKRSANLVSAARAKPGALNFSSVGVGSATHLSAERFRHSAEVDAVHVPFKGGAEAMTEVIAGRIDFFFGPVGLVLSQVQEGKLRALVVNGAKRSSALPNVPTTSEAGIANAEYPIWFRFVPARQDAARSSELHGETLKAASMSKGTRKLAALGIDTMASHPRVPATSGRSQQRGVGESGRPESAVSRPVNSRRPPERAAALARGSHCDGHTL